MRDRGHSIVAEVHMETVNDKSQSHCRSGAEKSII